MARRIGPDTGMQERTSAQHHNDQPTLSAESCVLEHGFYAHACSRLRPLVVRTRAKGEIPVSTCRRNGDMPLDGGSCLRGTT